MVYATVKVSTTVDESDVRRTHERAEVLRRCGLETVATAGGRLVRKDAAELARQLGVRLLMEVEEPID
jgi:hypothetical protein